MCVADVCRKISATGGDRNHCNLLFLPLKMFFLPPRFQTFSRQPRATHSGAHPITHPSRRRIVFRSVFHEYASGSAPARLHKRRTDEEPRL